MHSYKQQQRKNDNEKKYKKNLLWTSCIKLFIPHFIFACRNILFFAFFACYNSHFSGSFFPVFVCILSLGFQLWHILLSFSFTMHWWFFWMRASRRLHIENTSSFFSNFAHTRNDSWNLMSFLFTCIHKHSQK